MLIDESMGVQANRSCIEDDIAMLHDQGFNVNNDNKPVPENILALDVPALVNTGLYKEQSWGWDWIDHSTINGGYEEPSLQICGAPSARATLNSSSMPTYSCG